MLTGRNNKLKSQDILLLLKIIALGNAHWRIIDLAFSLSLSPSEISLGLERLKLSTLIKSGKRLPNKPAVVEFLVHGLKYFIPAEVGSIQFGIPTAHTILQSSNPPPTEIKYVWPSDIGEIKGVALSPIYETAPLAALKDINLHKLLAIVDLIRIGQETEQLWAKEELQKLLS